MRGWEVSRLCGEGECGSREEAWLPPVTAPLAVITGRTAHSQAEGTRGLVFTLREASHSGPGFQMEGEKEVGQMLF